MIKRRGKEFLSGLAFVLAAVLSLHLTAAVLRPAHTDYGSTWTAYLCEPENSIDVLFLGSSYAYCDWNPSVIYEVSGLTSYVMAGSEQTPALTYWYLREALETQHPQAVVMEVTSAFFQRYQNYTQINVVYMPWGKNRLGAIFEASEPDKRLGLCFDLWFYHDRWKELTLSDFKKVVTPPQADQKKGHTAIPVVFDQLEGGPFYRESIPDELYQQNLTDVLRIAALCETEDIDLIFTINPTYTQCTAEAYAQLERDLAVGAPQARFYNWANNFEAAGLDVTRHLSDAGHFNQEGAAVFSAYTGGFLRELGYEPQAQPTENQAAWENSARHWREVLDSAEGV